MMVVKKARDPEPYGLLLCDCYRENQVAGANIVNYVQALYNLTEAGVYAVQVLSVAAVMADKELRATCVAASVSHRQYATVVVLARS